MINNLEKYNHKIYNKNGITIIIVNGNSYELVKELEDNSIDLLFTDPPYLLRDARLSRVRINSNPGTEFLNNILKKRIKNIYDIAFSFDMNIFETIKQKMKNNKINYYLFCSDKQLKDYYNYFDNKKIYSRLITWCKNVCPPFGWATYRPNTEFLLDFREYGGYFNIKEKSMNKSLYYICPPPNRKGRFHVAEKPIELLKYYLNIKSFENSWVLDCFAGSCPTAIACYEMKRNCICFEKDVNYYNKSIERLNNYFNTNNLLGIL